jgi:galactokinase
MMGGGFGGCTINLVKEEVVDELAEQLKKAYAIAMQKELKIYIAQIGSGTSLIN